MTRVTLGDVAERAGVSLATASKVMNGRNDVKDATRRAVHDAARGLGYAHRRRTPTPARSLVMVFDALSSPYALQILHGATLAARRAGVDLAVTTTEEPDAAGPEILSRAWFREAADRGHAAVIAVTTPISARHLRASRACDIPLLVIDPAAVGPAIAGEDGPFRISATNWLGGRAATEHLVGLGHRRIGAIAGPAESLPGRERLEGYRSALEQAGIPFDPDLVVGDSYDFEGGRACTRRLLSLPEPPTAIFATADTVALGVLRAAHELGVRVPEQLSVVGFDDTLLAGWSSPQLTVVRQPLYSMGQVAVERALALAVDPERFAHPIQLETQLVERESTARAARRA